MDEAEKKEIHFLIKKYHCVRSSKRILTACTSKGTVHKKSLVRLNPDLEKLRKALKDYGKD